MPQVVLITGCSTGIGRSLCLELSHRPHYKIYATARKPETLNVLVAEAKHKNIVALAIDVCDEGSVKACVREIVSKEGRIDILINNAGIGATMPAAELDMVKVRKAYETNVFGLMMMVNEGTVSNYAISFQVFPTMASRRSGKIVNVGSPVGRLTLPFGSVYSSTKAAVELYTDGLRVEVKPFGIQTMLVIPGGIRSSIADHGFYLKKDGLYTPFAECVEKRSRVSQSPKSTPADVFAKGLAIAIDKERLPLTYTAGYMSSTLVLFAALFPKWLRDFLGYYVFGLSKVQLEQIKKHS